MYNVIQRQEITFDFKMTFTTWCGLLRRVCFDFLLCLSNIVMVNGSFYVSVCFYVCSCVQFPFLK